MSRASEAGQGMEPVKGIQLGRGLLSAPRDQCPKELGAAEGPHQALSRAGVFILHHIHPTSAIR